MHTLTYHGDKLEDIPVIIQLSNVQMYTVTGDVRIDWSAEDQEKLLLERTGLLRDFPETNQQIAFFETNGTVKRNQKADDLA